ncbi:hypothetical protein HY994_02110 [Candidatus Micrarchaeota archaeon]|nr:hypothetical protein [Candidatus Micrarchaeota archaeon]
MVGRCDVCKKPPGAEHAHPICRGLEIAQTDFQSYVQISPFKFSNLLIGNPKLHSQQMQNMDALAARIRALKTQAKTYHETAPIPLTLINIADLAGKLDALRATLYPAATADDFVQWVANRKKENPSIR